MTLDLATDGTRVTMTLTKGESMRLSVRFNVNGVSLNLNGYALKMQIAMPTPVTLSTAFGTIVITDAANGWAQANISDTLSETFPPGAYACEFWTISSDGEAIRHFAGTFNVLQSITDIP